MKMTRKSRSMSKRSARRWRAIRPATCITSAIRLAAKVPGYDKDYIVVATTRPETMLGDTGVAVHPGRRALCGADQGGRQGEAAAGRPRDSDLRRRILRPGEGHRRGEDHAGARLQRLRGRQAARARADQRAGRPRAHQQRAAAGVPHARSLRGEEARRRRHQCAGPAREDRADDAHRAARRPLQRRHRAVADRPVVRQRRRAGQARHRHGRARQGFVRAEELGEDLLRVDAQHPAVVHLAPAVVGASDPGLVRPRRSCVRRRDGGCRAGEGRRALRQGDAR